MAEDTADERQLDAIFLTTVALFLGACLTALQKCLHIPYTVLLLLTGLALGIGGETYVRSWNFVGPGIEVIKELDAAFIGLLFLPPLLFAGAFGLPPEPLINSWVHIAMLGIVGVGTGTCMVGALTRYILPHAWTWTQALLFGAIVAATDPVAAVAVLREVNAPKEVSVVVDGEALVDDGIAATLFAVFRIFVRKKSSSVGGIIRLLCRQSLGGPATGLAFGLSSLLWLYAIPYDANSASTILLVAAYASYFVSEDIFRASGILATVALGMMLSISTFKIEKVNLNGITTQVWSAMEYIANTIVFIVSGVVIAGQIYSMYEDPAGWSPAGTDYGYASLLWVLLLVVRGVNLAIFWPILIRTGHGFNLQLAVLTAWSGIRGIVGLVLAFSILVDSSIEDQQFRKQCFFYLGTTVVLTVVLQGASYQALAKALHLDREIDPSEAAIELIQPRLTMPTITHEQQVQL